MQKLYFGTDGIRGHADQFPFIDETLIKIGKAIALWSIKKYNSTTPKLLIGHDTRISCSRIKKALETGLHAHGISITDAGVIPTPAILNLMQNDQSFNFGIVISASHNPYTDNGIKILDAKSGKLTHGDESIILTYFQELSELEDHTTPYEVTPWSKATETYELDMLAHFEKNLFSGLTVVLDCANGATYQSAPFVFKQLGATVITINNTPNGININKDCGALHTESLQQTVKEHNADAGFAFDGDGDRVIAVNKNGEVKNGDDIIALLLSNHDFQHTPFIVGTIMTNHGFDQYLKNMGKSLMRTPVGDKYVAAALEKHNGIIGGEASGHIIIKSYLNTGDGIFVALKVLETIVKTGNKEMITFQKYPQVLINVPIYRKADLEQEPYCSIIEKHKELLENGRIVARYSGTENVLRIMVEDCHYKAAHEIAQTLADKLQKALSN